MLSIDRATRRADRSAYYAARSARRRRLQTVSMWVSIAGCIAICAITSISSLTGWGS